MALAGTLEIQMLANLARLSDDMGKAKSMVGSSMKSIEASVASAKSALGALGIGLGVGYFVTLIKGSIDAMDRLRDLSKTTDITVENLSGLGLAARQSGGDLTSIADSINKLSQNMGKDSDKFRALGVTAKEPLEAFKQLADIYTKLENPQQRAAVMAAALGKSWAGAAPLLAEGSAKIQEMVDKGTKLAGVTKDMADQADALNDKWVQLTQTGGLMTRMVGPMLPLLNMLADDMLRVQENSDKVRGTFDPMAETLRVMILLWGNFSFTFTQFGIAFAGVGAQIAAFSSGGWKAFIETRQMVTKVLLDERAAFDAWEKKVLQVGKNAPVAPGGAMDMGGSGNVFGGNKAAADAAAAFLNKEKADKAKDQAEKEALNLAQAEGAAEAYRVQQEANFFAAEFTKEQENIDLMLELKRAGQEEEIRMDAELAQIMDNYRAQERARDKAKQDDRIAGAHQFMGNMSGLMNTESKKLFEIGKVFAISDALLKGYSAVLDAFAFGTKIGGPYVGAAMAAAAGIATLNMINNIRSQRFGGTGGGGAPIAPTQGSSNISPVGAGGGGNAGRNQTTIINMPPGQFFDRKTVRDLLESMNENSADGGRVIVSEA